MNSRPGTDGTLTLPHPHRLKLVVEFCRDLMELIERSGTEPNNIQSCGLMWGGGDGGGRVKAPQASKARIGYLKHTLQPPHAGTFPPLTSCPPHNHQQHPQPTSAPPNHPPRRVDASISIADTTLPFLYTSGRPPLTALQVICAVLPPPRHAHRHRASTTKQHKSITSIAKTFPA